MIIKMLNIYLSILTISMFNIYSVYIKLIPKNHNPIIAAMLRRSYNTPRDVGGHTK